MLKDAWDAELKPYRLILGESNNNADNMLSTMPILNEGLVDKLLYEYMQRCSLKHALAFFQFRTHLPDAEMDDLEEIFCDRQEWLANLLKGIEKKLKKGALTKGLKDDNDSQADSPERNDHESKRAKQIDKFMRK